MSPRESMSHTFDEDMFDGDIDMVNVLPYEPTKLDVLFSLMEFVGEGRGTVQDVVDYLYTFIDELDINELKLIIDYSLELNSRSLFSTLYGICAFADGCPDIYKFRKFCDNKAKILGITWNYVSVFENY